MMKNEEMNCSKVFIGEPGCGKSIALFHSLIEAVQNGESAVLFTCEKEFYTHFSSNLDVFNRIDLEIFDFSDVKIYEKYALSLIPDLVLNPYTNDFLLAGHIEKIYQSFLLLLEKVKDQTLRNDSRFILNLACKAVFATPGQSFYHLYQFLTDKPIRQARLETLAQTHYPLLTEDERDALLALNNYRNFKNDGGFQLVERMTALFDDFRLKTLLSNAVSADPNMKRLTKNKGLTVVYLPFESFSQPSQDSFTLLLTLQFQLLHQATSDQSLILAYEELYRLESTLKYLKTTLPDFSRLNTRLFLTQHFYRQATSFLDELLNYPCEGIFFRGAASDDLAYLRHYHSLLKASDLKHYSLNRYEAFVIQPTLETVHVKTFSLNLTEI